MGKRTVKAFNFKSNRDNLISVFNGCINKKLRRSNEELAEKNRLFFRHIDLHVPWGPHGVPHCHGVYGDYAASFSVEDGTILAGMMPPKQEMKIRQWILTNQEDLLEKWNELSN